MNTIPSSGSLRRAAPIVAGLAAAVLMAVAAGCASEKRQDPEALRAEIDAANKHFMETFAKGDAATLAGAYTEDAQALPPGNQTVEGRSAIEAMWRGIFSLPVKELQIETREVVGQGDDASEVGRYRLIGNDGSVFEAGKYVVIWRRGEGGWKLYRDIWNADAPAPTLPAAAVADSVQ